MSSVQNQKFSLQVEKATLVPEESAVREFWSQLSTQLDTDPTLKSRFETDPKTVLSERGLALDLQREVLVASGISGIDFDIDCIITCCVSEVTLCEVTHIA
ncbi:hypothetical protein [Streptomyces sp. NBC_01013]|uniref:hypothetical protein n=1 Tax=Streptomyces sp. NBC_01013 TaxID=2903718 RepID=UPI0038680E81|nr:hypothetical protein OG538_35545 [Streptomyces sp. NBC_01013]